MRRVITAINNPILNKELKKENFIQVINKDLQYKEAILESLELYKEIDIIIINENLPGNIELIELIKKIKLINKKIKIYVILEKENKEKENLLKREDIEKILINNKILIKELINILNKNEIDNEDLIKEINQLKKIIESNQNKIKNNNESKLKRNSQIKNNNKNNNKNKITNNNICKNNLKINNRFNYFIRLKSISLKLKDKYLKKHEFKKIIKNNILIENVLKKYNNKFKKNMQQNLNKKCKIITISGEKNTGKSTISLLLSYFLEQKGLKIAIVDYNKLNFKICKNTIIKKKRKNIKKIIEKNIKENKKYYISKNYKYKIELLKYKRNKKNNKKIIKKYINKNKKKYKINKKYYFKKYCSKKIKNKIKIPIIKRLIKNLSLKIGKKIFLFSNLDLVDKNYNNLKLKSSEILLDKLGKDFNIIIVELGDYKEKISYEEFIRKSTINLIMMRPNLLGIKHTYGIINKYTQRYNIEKNSLHIIENQKKFNSISSKIICKIFYPIKIESKIKYNKRIKKILSFDYITILKIKNLKRELKKLIRLIIS